MSPAAARRREVRPPDPWLAQHLRAWIDAGLITDEQMVAVEQFEAVRRDVDGSGEAAVRLGPVSEAAAYVGAVLALIGGAVGLGPGWGSMPLAVRLVIAAMLAVVGFAAGTWLTRLAEAGTTRLGSFLCVLGTGGVALAAGTIANEAAPDSAWIAVAIGVSTAAVGLGLWRNRERPLQLLTAGVGAALAAGGLLTLLALPPWSGGVLLWVAAVSAAGATGRFDVHPLLVARCMAGAAAIAGAFMLGDLNVRLGATLALTTASVVILMAIRLQHHTPLLVIGVVGAIAAVQTLVQTTFRGPVGGAGVALAGVATVLAIVMRARRRPGAER